jgi:hypothetical protein
MFRCVMNLRLELDSPARSASPTSTEASAPSAPPANRRGSMTAQTAAAPPKSPLFRKHTDHWDDEDNAGGQDWASDGEDDDRQEDFLNLDTEGDAFDSRRASISPAPSSFMSSPSGAGALDFATSPTSSSGGVPPPPRPASPVSYVQRGIAPAVLIQMEGWNSALIAAQQVNYTVVD